MDKFGSGLLEGDGALEAIHSRVGFRLRKVANVLNRRAAAAHVNVSRQLAPYDESNTDPNHVHLRDQINREKGDTTPGGIERWTVKSGASYSGYLEFGTSRISAQPFFVPGYEAARRQLREEIAAITQVIMAGGEVPDLPINDLSPIANINRKFPYAVIINRRF